MKQDSDDQLTDLDDLQASQDPATLQERIIRRRSSKGTLRPCVSEISSLTSLHYNSLRSVSQSKM